jgi:hypothetical protein
MRGCSFESKEIAASTKGPLLAIFHWDPRRNSSTIYHLIMPLSNFSFYFIFTFKSRAEMIIKNKMQ